MPMNQNQQNTYAALGTAAGTLNDKLVAYAVAQTAEQNAAAALVAAKSALDAAWTNYGTADANFDGASLVAPTGYVPPTA
jgi:hypothetical protein